MKEVSQEIYDWWDQVVPIAQLFIVVICWAWGVDVGKRRLQKIISETAVLLFYNDTCK